jgi:U3 small nucleolar RNA-associated protein 10
MAATKHEQAVADLTVLLESRDWNETSGDAPLVAALMSVLSAVLAKRQHIKEGVDYLEQEILGAILALVEKIQQPEEIQKAHIGVEVIIKVIRGEFRLRQRRITCLADSTQPLPTPGHPSALCSLRLNWHD